MSSFYVVDTDKRPTMEQLHRLLAENTQLLRLMSEYGGGGKGTAHDVYLIQQRLHRNLIVLAESSKPEHWKEIADQKMNIGNDFD